ncbi:hypothetical protein EVJ32_04990 [Exiguobacterium sp. SH5S4]|uniref:hypothetical protein n=1 Tax=Exiguobacterium sp. SH5S4 TaxID=2510961 RepID=UPI001039D707|nr:hypothetical protein [Exiguobacterium sp. SH5S4]TCI26733.1 hypothetical protein EVJ32_04990 [Exiguobacterium sp. SH5S4]
MENEIVVEYLNANGVPGTERFKAWDKSGSFTLLYNDVSKDSLRLMIPTQNILSLRVIRPEDRAEEERDFVEKYVDQICDSGAAIVEGYLVNRVTDFLDKICKKYETENLTSGYFRVSLIKG